jgi:hypothetical protein
MYIAIIVKNILQLVFGYLSNSERDIKLYKLYNLQDSNYTYAFLIQLVFIYDFFLAVSMYLPLYLILFLIVKTYGNKFWFQIFYILGIYLLTVCFFDNGNFNYLFMIITILLGIQNWYLFKKWIKFSI